MGPSDFKANDVYLRTAIGVDAQGLGELRLRAACPTTAGASSSPTRKPDRKIGFGDHMGQPVWQQVPGEYRSTCAA